jgi:hypothetical protein
MKAERGKIAHNHKEISSMKKMLEAMLLREEASSLIPTGPQTTSYCAGEGHLLDNTEVKQLLASRHSARTLRTEVEEKNSTVGTRYQATTSEEYSV